MTQVYVGLGSNIEPLLNLPRAIAALSAHHEVQCSTAYRNPALGFEGDDFVNLVVGFATDASLAHVLALLKKTELDLGRDLSQPRFAPKLIDLDLLFYGDEVLRHDRVQLPPEEIDVYYLGPLAELAPDWVNPVTGKTCAQTWAEAETTAPEATAVELVPAASWASSELKMEKLRLPVHLGVGETERSEPQDVFFSVCLIFAEPPGACGSDDVAQTMDYAVLRDLLAAEVDANPFKTIEHLANRVMALVTGALPDTVNVEQLEVEVHKFPQVPGLEGGARFTLAKPR